MAGSGPQAGGAAGTGQHAGRWNLMAAGGAVEPVFAVLALGFGQSLLFPALGALTVHLLVFYVILEKQAATGAGRGVPGADPCPAVRARADEDGLAAAAPELPFFHFLAHRTFFHDQPRR